jgi:hypothetical protein
MTMGETLKLTLNVKTQSPCEYQAVDRLGELEAENSRLKRLLAELLIKNHELRQSFRMATHSSADDVSWA